MRIYIDKSAIEANVKALENSRPPFTPPRPMQPVIVVQNRTTGEVSKGFKAKLRIGAVEVGEILYDPALARGGNTSVWIALSKHVEIVLDGKEIK